MTKLFYLKKNTISKDYLRDIKGFNKQGILSE